MRIGTNHGSLSARILSYYGDTPRYIGRAIIHFIYDTRLANLEASTSHKHNSSQPFELKFKRPHIIRICLRTTFEIGEIQRAMSKMGLFTVILSCSEAALTVTECRGMVSSAFEFADVCRDLDYHNFLFSMKASNPLVMVQAYRLLAAEQYRLGWDYPLHLG